LLLLAHLQHPFCDNLSHARGDIQLKLLEIILGTIFVGLLQGSEDFLTLEDGRVTPCSDNLLSHDLAARWATMPR